MKLFFVLTTLLLMSSRAAYATTSSDAPWRADASLAFGILQEQAKNSSGESGGRLFQSVNGAALLSGSYKTIDWLDAGLFFMFETGVRSAAEFGGVNSSGVPTTQTRSGGHYTMYWLGPMIRPHWRNLFLEIGYVALGLRDDNAYPALISVGGTSKDSFRTDPLRAWMFTLGMMTPLADRLNLTLKIEYRFLYYNRRGDRLANDLVYGTQAIRPHIGLAFNF